MEKTEPNSLTESKSLTWTECHRFLIKISFLFFGVSTLLVFFTFLADLDYFDYYQLTNNQNPNIVYPFLIFTLNIIVQFFFMLSKKAFPLRPILIYSFIAQIIILIFMPLSILPFRAKDRAKSFWLTSALMLLFGAPEGTVIGCFMELVSYFPIDCVIYFSTGQAVAAVIMNIVKYISLGCFPVIEGSKNEEKNLIYGTLLLFGVTLLTLVVCFVIVISI